MKQVIGLLLEVVRVAPERLAREAARFRVCVGQALLDRVLQQLVVLVQRAGRPVGQHQVETFGDRFAYLARFGAQMENDQRYETMRVRVLDDEAQADQRGRGHDLNRVLNQVDQIGQQQFDDALAFHAQLQRHVADRYARLSNHLGAQVLERVRERMLQRAQID